MHPPPPSPHVHLAAVEPCRKGDHKDAKPGRLLLRTQSIPLGSFPSPSTATGKGAWEPGKPVLRHPEGWELELSTSVAWQVEVGITNSISTDTLWPWEFLILRAGLPGGTPGPKPWRQDSSAQGRWLPQPWTRGGAAAPLFLKDGRSPPGLA